MTGNSVSGEEAESSFTSLTTALRRLWGLVGGGRLLGDGPLRCNEGEAWKSLLSLFDKLDRLGNCLSGEILLGSTGETIATLGTSAI